MGSKTGASGQFEIYFFFEQHGRLIEECPYAIAIHLDEKMTKARTKTRMRMRMRMRMSRTVQVLGESQQSFQPCTAVSVSVAVSVRRHLPPTQSV